MHTSKVKTLLIGSQIGPTRFIRKTKTSVPRLAPGDAIVTFITKPSPADTFI